MKKSLITLAITSLFSIQVAAHGNVDVSKGSQIEVYMANEQHHSHDDDGEDKAYGIEAVFMNDSGYFIYAEGETGAHEFYQLGGGKYFNVNDSLGMFAYGAYAQGGYLDSNELRARVGADYQVIHELTLHARLGFDYGNSKIQLSDHDHDHAQFSDHQHDAKNSQVGRVDLGFSYDIGHVAAFSYNYVMQQQLQSELVEDNKTNLHYEARLSYTASTLQPYVEYRQTNKAFDEHHFEESAVQFGVSFQF